MKKILSAILSAVMSVSMLSIPVHAAETTPSGIAFTDIGAEIEEFAAEQEDAYASLAAAVFCGDEVLYTNHFEYIDRENKIAADESCVYEWAASPKCLLGSA